MIINIKTMKKIYISGKISGIEKQARKLFAEAENELKAKGFEPVNPMIISHNHDKNWRSFIKEDVKALCGCDAIFMLNNWRDSKGATIELSIANYLELDVIHQHSSDHIELLLKNQKLQLENRYVIAHCNPDFKGNKMSYIFGQTKILK